MPMRLEGKKTLVAEVNEVAKRALSAVAVENLGLTAGKFDDLRKKARTNGIYLHVIKNSLVKRAVQGTDFECMTPALTGPLVFGFSLEDPGAVGRLFKAFIKDNDKLVVKAVSVGGTLYGAKDLDRLATLPTRDQALSLLMSAMKAPISKFVSTLNGVPTKFVRTVQAVADKQGAAA